MTLVHGDEDGHIRSHTMCLFGRYSKLHTTCFSYTAVNSSAWSRLDALEGRGGTCGWVCKAWLAVLDWRIWTGHLGGGGVGRGTVSVPLWAFESWTRRCFVFSWPFLSSSCLLTPSHQFLLLFSFILSVLWPGSCVALAHAGSQHQSTLVRDFWVFNHALPQPLFLPAWVHPVYLIPIAVALREEETNICFTLWEPLESPEDSNTLSTVKFWISDNVSVDPECCIYIFKPFFLQ